MSDSIAGREPNSSFFRWRIVIIISVLWIGANLTALAWLHTDSRRPTQPPYRPSEHVLGMFEEVVLPLGWRGDEGDRPDVRLRLMSPAQVHEGQRYPLVLFLHGAGPRGNDNRRHLKEVPECLTTRDGRERFPCFLAAPQCPAGSHWTAETEVLVDLIEQLAERYPIDRRRVYLTGLSMGGFGCWHLVMHRPDLFAAVVPLCGGGDPSRAERLVGVPLWAVHGADDDVVPAEASRRMIEAIRQADGQPHYTELPGVGHDCWSQTYQDPDGPIPWMFRQDLSQREME